MKGPFQLSETGVIEASLSGSAQKSWDTKCVPNSSGRSWEVFFFFFWFYDIVLWMGIWQEVLSTFAISFDMICFTIIRSAGTSQLVSGFLTKGINLYVAVELVCLWGKGKSKTSYSTTSLLLKLLFSLNLTPTKFFFQVLHKNGSLVTLINLLLSPVMNSVMNLVMNLVINLILFVLTALFNTLDSSFWETLSLPPTGLFQLPFPLLILLPHWLLLLSLICLSFFSSLVNIGASFLDIIYLVTLIISSSPHCFRYQLPSTSKY